MLILTDRDNLGDKLQDILVSLRQQLLVHLGFLLCILGFKSGIRIELKNWAQLNSFQISLFFPGQQES